MLTRDNFSQPLFHDQDHTSNGASQPFNEPSNSDSSTGRRHGPYSSIFGTFSIRPRRAGSRTFHELNVEVCMDKIGPIPPTTIQSASVQDAFHDMREYLANWYRDLYNS